MNRNKSVIVRGQGEGKASDHIGTQGSFRDDEMSMS